MIDFIVENYDFILKVIMIVLEVFAFLVIVFKKNKKNASLDSVLAALPSIVAKVEQKVGSGNGEEKKRLVIDIALRLYKKLTGVEVDSSKFSTIVRDISLSIEDILSAPQKKGK